MGCQEVLINVMVPEKYKAYAVTRGTYLGEMLFWVEDIAETHGFISIPKNINRIIPKDKFKFGIENEILDVADSIPENIYSILHAQYQYNKKTQKITKY